MKSLEARTTALKAQFELLVIGDGGLGNFLGLLLEGSTNILKFANNTDLLNVALVSTGIIVGANLVPKFITLLATMQTTIGQIALYTAETGSLSAGLKAVGISASIAQLSIIGLTLGISAGIMAYNAYISAQEDARANAVELADAYNSQKDSLSENLLKVKDETTTRQQLSEVIKSLTDSYSDEQLALEETNGLREKSIDLLYEEARAKAQETIRKTGGEYQKAKSFTTEGYSSSVWGYSVGTPEETLKVDTSQIDIFNEKIANGEKLTYNQQFALSALEKEYEELTSRISDSNNIIKSYDDATEVLSGNQKDWINSTRESSDAMTDSSDIIKTTAEEYQTLIDSTDDYASSTSNVINSIDMLNDAVLEQDENGALALDTMMSLIDNGYALALSFDAQTGACTLNKEAMIELVKAKIENQIKDLELLQTDIATKLQNDGIIASNSALGFLSLAQAKSIASKAGSAEAGDAVDEYYDAEAQIKALQSALKNVGKVATGAWSASSNGAKKASSSTSKATDALKEQKDTLEDLKSDYDKVIDFISDKYDQEIDKIEQAKDAQLDAIDAEISALQNKRDQEESYWDARINALNAQNDAIQAQMDLQRLQEALALAKSTKVKVFSGGTFGYAEDTDAVGEATQAIVDYQREQQMQAEVDILEQMKDNALANIDSQIAGWETYKEQMQANFDAQIAIMELQKENFLAMTTAYEDNQTALLASQLTGIDFENSNWTTRLSNLTSFVNAYNSVLAKLGSSDTSVSASYSGSSGTAYTPTKTTTTTAKRNYTTDVGTSKLKKYATGSDYIPNDQVSIIGDAPNAEAYIPSKLNNGVMMPMKQGDGIVNAGATSTLARTLTDLAKYGNINNGSASLTSNNSSSNSVVNNYNIVANVQDGEGFVDYINTNLKSTAVQVGSAR